MSSWFRFGAVRRQSIVQSATSLEFFSAATGANLIASRCFSPRILLLGPAHDVGWRAPLLKLLHHELHIRSDVAKEQLVTGAQIVQPGLSIRSFQKTMFWAFAVACETDVAFAAITRQHGALVQSKFDLRLRGRHHEKRLL